MEKEVEHRDKERWVLLLVVESEDQERVVKVRRNLFAIRAQVPPPCLRVEREDAEEDRAEVKL